MKFDTPPQFSCWVAWENRESLDNLFNPGVYAIAVSRERLSGKAFKWRKDIAYFGMTNSLGGLKGRLKQFHNTIMGNKGHGGAQRFMYDFNNAEALVPSLYVAVWPFACEVGSITPRDFVVMGCVAKAEYECFAKYAKLYKCLPKYNDKKNSPKRKRRDRAYD